MNYRIGVVGVFIDSNSRLLVCERSNRRGAWQFPQGGMDPGETPEQAMIREAEEELGCNEFKILSGSQTMTQYDFPKEASFKIAKQYTGQKHHWFQLQFLNNCLPNLEQSDGEFCAYKWVNVEESLDKVVYWKKDAYRHGLKLLGFSE